MQQTKGKITIAKTSPVETYICFLLSVTFSIKCYFYQWLYNDEIEFSKFPMYFCNYNFPLRLVKYFIAKYYSYEMLMYILMSLFQISN